MERVRDNLDAIALIKTLTAENRYATPDEQDILAKYVGWGHNELADFLADRMDPDWRGTEIAVWKRVQAEIEPSERQKIRKSTPKRS